MKSGNDAVKQKVSQQLLEKGGDLPPGASQDNDANARSVPTPPIAEISGIRGAGEVRILLRSLSTDDFPNARARV